MAKIQRATQYLAQRLEQGSLMEGGDVQDLVSQAAGCLADARYFKGQIDKCKSGLAEWEVKRDAMQERWDKAMSTYVELVALIREG